MAEEKPKAEYQRFESEGDYQQAVDRLLEQPGRELRIFDPDLSSLRLNSPARIAQLEKFLRFSRTRRIYIVVHHTEPLAQRSPRMMGLLKLFTHAIQINQTHEEIRSLQDAFMVLDCAALPAPAGRRFLPRRDRPQRRDRGPGDALALPGNLVLVLPRRFERDARLVGGALL